MTITVDRSALEAKVKDMYTAVANRPDGEFHVEMGRAMAERLGYASADLDKVRVFQEASRLLRRGGRLAVADIVSDTALPETVVCNADLWAACIGGAAQIGAYRAAIGAAGLRVERLEENTRYQFISDRAKRATAKYGVKSVSVLARKP